MIIHNQNTNDNDDDDDDKDVSGGNLKGDDHVKQAHVAAGLVWVKAHEAQRSHLHHNDENDEFFLWCHQ